MNPQQASPSTAVANRSLSDEQLETLVVRLLSELEQQMLTLERTDSVKRMIRMIETSLKMLVSVIDLGIDNYDVQFFAAELPSVWRLRERSKIVLDVLDREAWSSFFNWGPKANFATQTMHRNLGKSFSQVFRELLARFGQEFQSEPLRRDWYESCDVFLTDFQQRW